MCYLHTHHTNQKHTHTIRYVGCQCTHTAINIPNKIACNGKLTVLLYTLYNICNRYSKQVDMYYTYSQVCFILHNKRTAIHIS